MILCSETTSFPHVQITKHVSILKIQAFVSHDEKCTAEIFHLVWSVLTVQTWILRTTTQVVWAAVTRIRKHATVAGTSF